MEIDIGKTTCNHCGEQFPSEYYLMYRHMRTKHPERWEQILKEADEDRERQSVTE